MSTTQTISLQAPGTTKSFSLPPLRQDINLYPGPRKQDGSPTWSLHDPVNNRFFRIGWLEFELLSRWQSGDADTVLQQVNHGTTLHADMSHVMELTRLPEDQPTDPGPRQAGHHRAL